MKHRTLLIICMIIITSFSSILQFGPVGNTALAQPIYVGPGSTYTSIQDAVDNATSGDVIYIANGTYNGSVTVGVPGITLIGNSTSLCRLGHSHAGSDIIGDYAAVFNITAVNVTISGFNITVSGSYTYALYLNTSAAGTVIENNVIYVAGNDCGGVVLHDTDYNNMADNLFYLDGNASDGIIALSATNVSVVDNTVSARNTRTKALNMTDSNDIIVERFDAVSLEPTSVSISAVSSAARVYNSSLDPAAGTDIVLQADADVTFTNVTFSTINATQNSGGTLWVMNYLDILVFENDTFTPLAGADVLVTDNGAAVYNSTGFGGTDPKTGPAGRVGTITVVDRWYPRRDTPLQNLTVVNVSASKDASWYAGRSVDIIDTDQVKPLPAFQQARI